MRKKRNVLVEINYAPEPRCDRHFCECSGFRTDPFYCKKREDKIIEHNRIEAEKLEEYYLKYYY
ncbi:MAG: hypothetical protein FWC41_00005 [Firmicutes bacterium]|nr:hypothetical protein [Bacillota bacterium]